jgi:UDP-N-acetylglucosamine transferase subunit ALG13
MQHEAFLSPSRAESLMRDASLIVAHAGMGSVLAALSLRKPIVILPRRGSLAEHRNDHQMATARWLEGRAGVFVAWETSDLAQLLDDRERLTTGEPICPHASGPLVARLSSIVAQALAEKRAAER